MNLALLERVRGSASFAHHLHGQADFPFRPLEAVHRVQDRRVRRMIAHAYATVPHYRETMDQLGLRPGDLRTAADLARLPLIERGQLQRDPARFRSTAEPPDRCLRLNSSGSSGAPLTIHCDAAAIIENAAHGERERSLATPLIGRRTGYREAAISGPHSAAWEIRRFLDARTLAPPGMRIKREFISLIDPPERQAAAIEAFRPDVLHGFGATLALLFAYYEASGPPVHPPKVVTFSSDALADPARRLIEERYGIPVFGTYQAIEAFKIGFECRRHRGYHLNVDLYPVRIVDAQGQPAPDGETGEVVISNLVNRATVLLNYRLGDLAAVSAEPCPCGRSLPLMPSLEGRSSEVVELPSGRLVDPYAVRTVFVGEDDVRLYQVVQRTPAHFAVAIVAAAGTDRDGLRARIAAGLAARLEEGITVEVTFVDAIERTAGGKLEPILPLPRHGHLPPETAGVGDG